MVFEVPTHSGEGSWARLENDVNEHHVLPAKSTIRLEEMVNHFQYKLPSMLKAEGALGLVADVEIGANPWNSATQLLAVHVWANQEAEISKDAVRLQFDARRVQRVRLLGYSSAVHRQGAESNWVAPVDSSAHSPSAQSQGHYMMYELETVQGDEIDVPLVTLDLGSESSLPVSLVNRWDHASSDFRFASVIAATGLMLNGAQSSKVDAQKLRSLVEMLEVQDGESLSPDRKEALTLILKTVTLAEQR